jgi:CDP-diacylglycerol--glycerol-3-phosphate 3-phosphatidyltransferase
MSADTSHNSGLTLATKVTLVRIMGVPVFVGLLVYYLHGLSRDEDDARLRIAALVLFVLIAATDALDGWLARSRNEITRLGKVLDPLADKSLLLSALILLTRPSLPQLAPHIPLWFTTLVISRDVVILVGYFLVHHFTGHVEVRARWSGKFATALTVLAICWVLMQGLENLFTWFIILAGVCTAVSMAQYIADGARQLGTAPHH